MEQIILEKDSTSTYENMLNSQKIMKEKDIRSVLIITEPFHAARVGLVAEKLGLDYTISPAIESPCWRWKYFSKYFLKEPFAIIAYKLQGKL